jgi:hypothetical protein
MLRVHPHRACARTKRRSVGWQRCASVRGRYSRAFAVRCKIAPPQLSPSRSARIAPGDPSILCPVGGVQRQAARAEPPRPRAPRARTSAGRSQRRLPGARRAAPGRALPRRSTRTCGLGCPGLRFLHGEIGVPALRHRAQLAVQRLDARLEQSSGACAGPLHGLLLAEAFADNLMDSGFHGARGDRFTIAPPLAVIRNEVAVALDIRADFLHLSIPKTRKYEHS